MRPQKTHAAAPLVLLLLTLSVSASAQIPGPPLQRLRPKVEFDNEKTPLQKSLEEGISKQRKKMQGSSPDCTDAMLADLEAKEAQLAALLAIDNPTNEQKRQIRDARKVIRTLARLCKGPGKSSRKLADKEVMSGGKKIGKRLETETVIDYETPAERPGKDQQTGTEWPSLVVKNVTADEFSKRSTSPGSRLRGAGFLPPASPKNDDGDCIDRVTGRVTTNCFDADGHLRQTLTPTTDTGGATVGCRHEGGATFAADPTDGVADDCFDEAGVLRTTLRELIDEDWKDENVDTNGDGVIDAADEVDQDGDGRLGEDGPEDAASACARVGGQPTTDGGCDLKRLVIKKANEQAMAMDTDGDGEPDGKKAFKASADGTPDDTAAGEVLWGAERRRVRVNETLTVRCPQRGAKQAEFVDGQCVVSNGPAVSPLKVGGITAVGTPTEAANAGAAKDSDCEKNPDGTTYTCTKTAMMGFTVIPPKWEWGYKVSEEVCVDIGIAEFCFEVFFARVGYEFDFAAGLRLPVDLTAKDVPASALASKTAQIDTELASSENFTVKDYKEFCAKHRLDSSNLIRDCESFAEPEFLSSLDFTKSADEKDGAELIARVTAFAGLQVRVVEIPIINWALDLDVDLPKMCTLNRIKKLIDDGKVLPGDLIGLGTDLAKRKHLYDLLRDHLGVCGSFETPFGYDDAPPPNPGKVLKSFPFNVEFEIPADCTPEPSDVATTDKDGKDKKQKVCTGLILGTQGASLGVGLGFVAEAGSTLIEAKLGAAGDGKVAGDQSLQYSVPFGEGSAKLRVGPFDFDNHDGATDEARVSFDDFLYHLNAFQIQINANLEFGGILSPLPNLASITLLQINFDLGDNSPIRIPQHNGTSALTLPVFVENYALSLDAKPADADPKRVNKDTLSIKPGEFGQFRVYPTNLGSVADAADTFARLLSNRPDQSGPFTFVINRNTDFDCRDTAAAGVKYFGYPYDNVADDCYTATGALRADRVEAIDEDDFGPGTGTIASRDSDGDGKADEDPDDENAANGWAGTFDKQSVANVPAHAESSEFFTLSVRPLRHPLTRPGLYPVRVTADSLGARVNNMPPSDPLSQARAGASDTVFVKVETFFDPRVALDPTAVSVFPGGRATYRIEGANYGNATDTIKAASAILDSNAAGCTLTTLGTKNPGCPYRAEVTRVPAAWLTPSTLPAGFGSLEPLGSSSANVEIAPPSTWAGMDDTTYEITFKAQSTAEPGAESETKVLRLTVRATRESMTRYIGLEIRSFIEDIERANRAGIKTGGLHPVLIHPVETTNGRALEAILARDFNSAARMHETMIKVMGGFLHQLEAQSLSAALKADWTARAQAIVADLKRASTYPVTAAPTAINTAAAKPKRLGTAKAKR